MSSTTTASKRCIGVMDSPALATAAVEAHNIVLDVLKIEGRMADLLARLTAHPEGDR